jgi:hypothetical protein
MPLFHLPDIPPARLPRGPDPIVVIAVKNLRTNLVYQSLTAASALTMLAAVVAAGKKW